MSPQASKRDSFLQALAGSASYREVLTGYLQEAEAEAVELLHDYAISALTRPSMVAQAQVQTGRVALLRDILSDIQRVSKLRSEKQ